MTDQQIIELIKSRKEGKALTKLYRYQPQIVAMIKSRGGSKDDALDVFQEALIILCKKIWETNFELHSKLDTYLYSVSYYIWKNKAEKDSKWVMVEGEANPIEIDGMDEVLEKEAKINRVEKVLQELGEPCLKLLQLFYYKGLSMQELASKLGYKTVNVAKTQKYKCIERARKSIEL
ncbi:MAG: sigma-70 family RNA polymerase sigma factor [Flavobacteriales bacterium]|nr:sigma-70 family RNA polymerase sigma factor [Flavobacteriales bacterium]